MASGLPGIENAFGLLRQVIGRLFGRDASHVNYAQHKLVHREEQPAVRDQITELTRRIRQRLSAAE